MCSSATPHLTTKSAVSFCRRRQSLSWMAWAFLGTKRTQYLFVSSAFIRDGGPCLSLCHSKHALSRDQCWRHGCCEQLRRQAQPSSATSTYAASLAVSSDSSFWTPIPPSARRRSSSWRPESTGSAPSTPATADVTAH